MTFLNPILLFGLVGMAIPIIIHFLNRRRAHVVDWGAMQFLEDSLTSRSRRILIEELILMALRCVLLGLLAAALARPFVQAPALLAGDSADAQDVAIVLDGSLSMTLAKDGTSLFDRGVDEARQMLNACRNQDAVSVLVAGSAVDPVIAKPLSDRKAIGRALAVDPVDGAGEPNILPPVPTGGTLDVPGALTEAIRSLAAGGNPGKKIVLITDGQRLGWDLSSADRWKFLSEESRDALKTLPTVIVRTLSPPEQWKNVAVGQVNLDRSTIGTDREVEVSVTLDNTGKGTIRPEAVRLSVDGKAAGTRQGPEIADGASATVTFRYRFQHPGPGILTVDVDCDDNLPGDNRAVRVVNVMEELPVLVVEGKGSTRPLGGDAAFLSLALAPIVEDPKAEARELLIRPTIVQAHEVGKVKRFDPYRVVILADVPRLPAATAKALAEYVAAGGGLLIAPGAKAERDFYNSWLGQDQRRVAGCSLTAFEPVQGDPGQPDKPLRVAPNTIDSPAIRLVADPAISDLTRARVWRRWMMSVDRDAGASVGASLDNGDPYLIQRKLGDGLVIALSVPLDAEYSDLALHECYPVMLHELTYYLAAPRQYPLNVQPGQRLVWPVPGKVNPGDTAEVLAPTLRRWPAKLTRREGRWMATCDRTAVAGLYRLLLPDAALGDLATRPAVAATDVGAAPGVPFAVLGNPDESRMDPLTEADIALAGQSLQVQRAETLSQLLHAIGGGVPGSEIWKILAIVCAMLLAAEIALTRLIAIRRQVHLARPVAFGADQVDADTFRQEARRTLPARPAREETAAL